MSLRGLQSHSMSARPNYGLTRNHLGENEAAAVDPENENFTELASSRSTEESVDESLLMISEENKVVDNSWKGYLSEKGPSRVLVKYEEITELQTLPDEVWALIMGEAPEVDGDYAASQRKSSEELEVNVVQLPENQKGETHVDEKKAGEEMRIDRGIIDDEFIKIEDESESYHQLMELFNRPVFAMPASELNDADGMLSFQGLKNAGTSNVRDGSRARFEIRKN